jgi:hypothetical protein
MKNLRAALAAFLAAPLLIIAAVLAFGAPAQAAGSCSANSTICLYHWVNENTGGGVWRSTLYNIETPHAGCLNLTSTTNYDNGDGPVYDTEGSVVVNLPSSTEIPTTIELYYWANCNNAGGFLKLTTDCDNCAYYIDDLTYPPTTWSQNIVYHASYYHHIAAIGVNNS